MYFVVRRTQFLSEDSDVPSTEGNQNQVAVGSYGSMGRRIWTPTRNNIFARTAKFGRLVGRWIPIPGTVILAYDAIQVAICTKKCTDETCEK